MTLHLRPRKPPAENRFRRFHPLPSRDGGDGIRAWSADPSGAVTYYVNDEGRPVSELNSSGTVIANDSFGPFGLIRSALAYGSGASSFGRTGVAGNSHYYAYDPQGTPFLVLNDGSSAGTASVLTTYEDDAFGNQAAGNTAVTPASDPYVGFGGEWGYRTDAATGLELLEHRYYDPAAGRFVTRDPVGYEGGADLYECANNNPINEYDDGYKGKRRKDRGGGNDPLFQLSCDELKELQKTATGEMKNKIKGIMKLKGCSHSHVQKCKIPIHSPVPNPHPVILPKLQPVIPVIPVDPIPPIPVPSFPPIFEPMPIPI